MKRLAPGPHTCAIAITVATFAVTVATISTIAIMSPAFAAADTPASTALTTPANLPVAVEAPALVRVHLGPALTLERLLESGLDVVEVHAGRDALLLLKPSEAPALAALGATSEVVDPNPGATLARRTHDDIAAHPLRPAGGGNRSHRNGAQRVQTAPPFGSGSMGGYWTGDEIKLKLDDLVAGDTHDVVADKLDTVGTSRQGRPILGLKLGKHVTGTDTRPLVFYNAITHAREPEGMQALFYFVDDLLAKYGTDPVATSLLDHRQIYIVPLVNPDGYQINLNTFVSSGGTTFGFWRKNARDNDNNGTINTQDGVDINRNFGFKWGLDNVGSSPTRSSDVYRGPSAFSEPETQVQRDLVSALKPKTGLSFHTYSDLMLYPWGYTPAGSPDSAAFQEWTDAASLGDGYQTGPAPRVLYSVNGEFNDWVYGDTLLKPRAFTWTPEVGNPNDGFYPPPSRIVPLAAENLRRCYLVAAIAGADVVVDRATWQEGALVIGALNHVSVRARNLGLATAGPGLAAQLVSLDPGAVVTDGPIAYADLATRTSGDPSGGTPFTIATSDTLTPGRLIRFEVDFTTADGMFSRDSLEIPAGVPTVLVADDALTPAPWLASGGWGIALGNAIHPAPYFADSPAGAYPTNANTTLELRAALNLSPSLYAYATFETRWDIETGYDAAMLEAGYDSLGFVPQSGRGTSLGVPATQPVGLPIYQGTRQRWSSERVDLSTFARGGGTAVRLRFHLLSDGGSNFDGFNFDSLRVTIYDPAAQPPPTTAVSVLEPARLRFNAARPNPALSQAWFAFELPRAGATTLEIFDPSGRRVRRVFDGPLPAGRFERHWDLRDEHGAPVAPGVYLARLAALEQRVTRRFVVIH